MANTSLYPVAALVATGLSLHGYRKGSLSTSGAVAAFLVGYGHLANPIKMFGVTMIVFYLLGSRATKVKADVKARLEDGPDPSKPGGNRDAIQVLSNSLPSLVTALAFRFSYTRELHLDSIPLLSRPLARGLIYAALGHFATSLADTLASELGILFSSPPVSMLTLRPVPPGTNGGISVLGLAASAAGGAIMGMTMVLDLVIENGVLRDWRSSRRTAASAGFDLLLGEGSAWAWAWRMILFGTVVGLAGSLLDSLLGATLQETLFSEKDKRIMTDHSTRPRAGTDIKRIGIGKDVLSNSGVNFVCGATMAVVGWFWATR